MSSSTEQLTPDWGNDAKTAAGVNAPAAGPETKVEETVNTPIVLPPTPPGHRVAHIHRETSESRIDVWLDLDGTGQNQIDTGVPFYDHMLTALAKHSLIDMRISARGDVHIDVHHTVEDTAICLGQALREALGDKRGIRRFGDATIPLDEALARAVVDVAGRPYCVHTGESELQVYHLIGGHYTGAMTRHVFESLAYNSGLCLHIDVIRGRDPHHIVEAQFKALARALRDAVERDPRTDAIPSTKGAL